MPSPYHCSQCDILTSRSNEDTLVCACCGQELTAGNPPLHRLNNNDRLHRRIAELEQEARDALRTMRKLASALPRVVVFKFNPLDPLDVKAAEMAASIARTIAVEQVLGQNSEAYRGQSIFTEVPETSVRVARDQSDDFTPLPPA